MKVLVTGSTQWVDPEAIESTLDEYRQLHPELIVVTGMADGADQVARDWARKHQVTLLAEPLTAGDYPGPMHRYNERMLSWEPDVVLAFKEDLDLIGRPQAGTEPMCLLAQAADVVVRIFT